MKKELILAIAAGAATIGASGAFAASTNVDASVNISQTAVEIFTERGLNFGSFEITNASANGTVTVNINDTVSAVATGIVHGGNGNTAIVNISGTPGASIELSCSSSATLFHETETDQFLQVDSVNLEGHDCSTGVTSTNLGPSGVIRWDVGGVLTFDSPSTGIYSTANAGGTPITVDVVYQ